MRPRGQGGLQQQQQQLCQGVQEARGLETGSHARARMCLCLCVCVCVLMQQSGHVRLSVPVACWGFGAAKLLQLEAAAASAALCCAGLVCVGRCPAG